MNKVIQLRGMNASGKSTAMRQFAAREGLSRDYLEVNGIKLRLSCNSKCAVIGWYKSDTYSGAEGCDPLKATKYDIKDAIVKLMRKKYEVIAFEKFVYGITFSYTYNIYRDAIKQGYAFRALDFEAPYTEQLRRLMYRNGGNTAINFDMFDRKYIQYLKARKKLIQFGVPLKVVNTGKVNSDEMWKIIQDVIDESNRTAVR